MSQKAVDKFFLQNLLNQKKTVLLHSQSERD
jgi:hypothetical protein